jgi:hypothetical protein
MGAEARYARYVGPGPGEVSVELSREFFTPETVPSRVTITAGEVRRQAMLGPGERKAFVIPASELPLRVTVQIHPTFSAAGFGAGDERQLGARVQFGFRPGGS